MNPRLRRCRHAGRPFGDAEFVRAISERFGRHWLRERPKKEPPAPDKLDVLDLVVFGDERADFREAISLLFFGNARHGGLCGFR
jgi:hypothetical protein